MSAEQQKLIKDSEEVEEKHKHDEHWVMMIVLPYVTLVLSFIFRCFKQKKVSMNVESEGEKTRRKTKPDMQSVPTI